METGVIQIIQLLLLALPVASLSWTIAREEVFREPREYCAQRSRSCPVWYQRKFFYALTCEYCLSHWVALFFVALTRFHLLAPDWRGYVIALFALVWVANQYMSIYARLRLEIKRERAEIAHEERAANHLSPKANGAAGDRTRIAGKPPAA